MPGIDVSDKSTFMLMKIELSSLSVQIIVIIHKKESSPEVPFASSLFYFSCEYENDFSFA